MSVGQWLFLLLPPAIGLVFLASRVTRPLLSLPHMIGLVAISAWVAPFIGVMLLLKPAEDRPSALMCIVLMLAAGPYLSLWFAGLGAAMEGVRWLLHRA